MNAKIDWLEDCPSMKEAEGRVFVYVCVCVRMINRLDHNIAHIISYEFKLLAFCRMHVNADQLRIPSAFTADVLSSWVTLSLFPGLPILRLSTSFALNPMRSSLLAYCLSLDPFEKHNPSTKD